MNGIIHRIATKAFLRKMIIRLNKKDLVENCSTASK